MANHASGLASFSFQGPSTAVKFIISLSYVSPASSFLRRPILLSARYYPFSSILLFSRKFSLIFITFIIPVTTLGIPVCFSGRKTARLIEASATIKNLEVIRSEKGQPPWQATMDIFACKDFHSRLLTHHYSERLEDQNLQTKRFQHKYDHKCFLLVD